MIYQAYSFYYPPRPENCISPEVIEAFDDSTFLAQPKLNGSCGLLFTDGKEFRFMNRHNSPLTGIQILEELKTLNKTGKWMVLVGEYLNKNKLDENKKSFNHKFVIFDILVYENNYLLGSTFFDRQVLLDSIFKLEDYNFFLNKISDNIFRVKNFTKDFYNVWKTLVQIDVCEGIVFKRKKSPLEIGNSLKNNHKSQFKCRKPHKNYKF